MKSELLDSIDRFKAESRQSIHRRRMSKAAAAAAVVNGESNGDNECGGAAAGGRDMGATIQGHIACTRSAAELLKLQEDKVALACELDHMYANCSNDSKARDDDSPQLKQLRDLFLLNLDLLQQQHDQILAKDHQLAALKQEKDALKQRLERMERRLSLMKQKEHFSDQQSSEVLSNQDKSEDAPLSPGQEKQLKRIDRRQKRKLSTESLSFKRNNSASYDDSQSKAALGPRLSDTKRPCKNKDSKAAALLKKENILRTEILYHTNNGLCSPLSPAPDEEVLAVPNWRLHPVTSCYQLEGTENLDDEVFMKRHQKLEIDERRRKRWDIQRIREQRLQDKLKRGRYAVKEHQSHEDPEMHSFNPSPEEAQYVEVSDTVPVCAFGYPVPNFQPCEFSLPWFILNDLDKQDKQKANSQATKKQRPADKRGS